MKKIALITISILLYLGLTPIAFAQNGAQPITAPAGQPNSTQPTGKKSKLNEFLPSIDDLKEVKKAENTVDTSDKAFDILQFWDKRLEPVERLPRGSFESILADIIKTILGIGATLAALGIFIAGVMYIVARDDEELVNKAKKIILYCLIGLILISISFAIFTGLASMFIK